MKTSWQWISRTALVTFVLVGVWNLPARAQSAQGDVKQGTPVEEKPDPLKRQPSDKERFKQQKELRGS